MQYKMMPVVSLATLVKELKIQHNIIVGFKQLRNILWYEPPGNDCHREYYYGDGPIVADSDDPDRAIENCVIMMLEECCPDWDSVLIDVTY
jgi:hypothetical protein